MCLDYIAAIFELLGLYLIGNRSWYGFASNIIGGILWILAVFISHEMFGLLLVVIPAIILNIININKWKKNVKT
jgi:hypothetical protein